MLVSQKYNEPKSTIAGKSKPFFSPVIQKKLSVGSSNDSYEIEADKVADTVMKMSESYPQINHTGPLVQKKCAACEEERIHRKPLVENITPLIQRKSTENGGIAPSHVESQINSNKGGGSSMDNGTRNFMENRFGTDFSNVRIHTGNKAVQMSRELNAQAFTVGNDIYFNEGKYNPDSGSGKHLLAHELTHTVQQSGKINNKIQKYTEEERREMAERRVVGRPQDITMANARNFQQGDIVFRMGNTALGYISGQEVTHGGIYIGSGLIHDVVGFGNRNVRVTDFYDRALNEADNMDTYRVIRFIGPNSQLIVTRLIQNINNGIFDMPTDPIPFNLFSSAGDYRTATCLEYAHAQFLFAIRNLVLDVSVSEADRASLRNTYFRAGSSRPNNLISPTNQRITGTPYSSSSSSSQYNITNNGGLSSIFITSALVTAASTMAHDVNPLRFSNRDESTYRIVYPYSGNSWGSSIGNILLGPLYDENVLNTFTYQSFVNSTRFFTVAGSS